MSACRFVASDQPRAVCTNDHKPREPMCEDETWRPVVNYEGHYEVSSLGRVRSLKHGGVRIMLGQVSKSNGYPSVNLSLNGRGIYRTRHRLVAEAFLGPCPPGHEVCHNDGDKLNPRLDNLRYDTRSANVMDSVLHGTHWSHNLKTHCKRGHEFTPENTRVETNSKGRPVRVCRTCLRERRRAQRERKRESA